jgi:hypothetical protein
VLIRGDADLIQRLSRSEIYSDYERAFGESTELPLMLRPTEFWQLPHRKSGSRESLLCVACSDQSQLCRLLGSTATGCRWSKGSSCKCDLFCGSLRHCGANPTRRTDDRFSADGSGRPKKTTAAVTLIIALSFAAAASARDSCTNRSAAPRITISIITVPARKSPVTNEIIPSTVSIQNVARVWSHS